MFIANILIFVLKLKNFPTIDHKTSILYGFLNDIPIEIISDIENLCITKRSNNSKKKTKNEIEFNLLISN